MDARIRPLPFDPAALRGLSEKLVLSHHQNNYGGAVKRLNAIRARLATLPFATAPGLPAQRPEARGADRHQLDAAARAVLRLSSAATARRWSPRWQLALAANFGSVERWREEFVALGKALGGGSGWVLLSFQPREGTLVNQWAADHTHALAGGVPILALDMYEHSYHLDFGAAASAYVDAFMANIDWAPVYARYQAAVHRRQRALRRDAGRGGRRRAARRAPRRRVRAGQHHDSGCALARPRPRGRVVQRIAGRPRADRLLRLWARGRTRHGDAPARRGPERALPARRHRRLAGRRPASRPQGSHT